MTLLALHTAFTLPIQDPILKFLIIMTIVLGTPLILNKLKIPYLLGLIIAGAVIGEHGLNLVARDSSIILSGTAGMLYILFMAGLEMDMADFKRNSLRSFAFGQSQAGHARIILAERGIDEISQRGTAVSPGVPAAVDL